jgi:hypothetical protein
MSYMPPKHVKTDRFANAAKTTAADECAIQKNIDRNLGGDDSRAIRLV